MKTHGSIPQAAPKIVVRGLSARSTRGVLTYGNLSFPCAFGRSGRQAGKREGDGATPLGSFALRQAFYRPDRLPRPRTRLPLSPIDPIRRLVRCTARIATTTVRSIIRTRRAPSACGGTTGSTTSSWSWATTITRASPAAAARCSCMSAGPASTPTEGCIALARPHLLRLLRAIAPDTSDRLIRAHQKKRPGMPKHRAEFRARLGEGARSGEVRGPRTG